MRDTQRLSPQRGRAAEGDEEVRETTGPEVAPPKTTTGRARSPRPDPLRSVTPGRLDKHVMRRIKRGAQSIEARLDMHGMTQKEAHADLRRFIRDTTARGCRCVLVITGKGSRSGTEDEFRESPSGVLRRVVPQWLEAPDLFPLVAGFEPALPQHGGTGALYVQLRRRQSEGGG